MLDQSFSSENFRKILDIENRKGSYLEGEFFGEVESLNTKLKDLNEEIKKLKQQNLDKETFVAQKQQLEEKKEQITEEKLEKILQRLATVSTTVTSNNFSLAIKTDTTLTSKPVYRLERTLENILTMKQLQYNFFKLYKVKQAQRYTIISQLKSLLDDEFPKVVLKTDIQEFYESIPHSKLLKKLNDENLISHLSQKFIHEILNDYRRKSGSSKGVPRGIGISPLLTELYMRDIDIKIKSMPNVIYYARYVDDMIILFMPEVRNTQTDYKNIIKDILSEEDLTMNEEDGKTKFIDLREKSKNGLYSFEYLGFKFIGGYKQNKHIPLTLTISKRKKIRYKEKILSAFTLYLSGLIKNEKKARKILIKRLRFLTSNTRLVNNKRNVVTGIYYSNSLVNTIADFEILDRYLKTVIKKLNLIPALQNRISAFSFVKGFNPAHMSKFNGIELKTIMKNWTK